MKTHSPDTKDYPMKITRRAKQRITLIVATRRAEAEAVRPQLNYDNLFDGLIYAVHDNV